VNLCPEKKFYNSKPTALSEPEVLQNAKQGFFMPTLSKKAKKCQTMTYMPSTILSCQTTLKKANFWNFAIKMPAWQP